jgi:hypothetical protein
LYNTVVIVINDTNIKNNSFGNVKAQVVENGKWVCDKCRSERTRELKEKLQGA